MKAIIFFLCMALVFKTMSQKISIKNIQQLKQSQMLRINLVLINDSIEHRFYKMEIDDICYSLLNIKIIDTKKNNKFYYFFPCKGFLQLDNIKFTKDNTFIVAPKSKYEFSFLLSNYKSIMLKPNWLYKIEIMFNYDELPNYENGIYDKKITTTSKIFKTKKFF